MKMRATDDVTGTGADFPKYLRRTLGNTTLLSFHCGMLAFNIRYGPLGRVSVQMLG